MLAPARELLLPAWLAADGMASSRRNDPAYGIWYSHHAKRKQLPGDNKELSGLIVSNVR